MKILSVVGARPQFVKAGVVSRELRQTHQEILVHSGQHYDANMSEVFFDELGLPAPDENLGVGSGSHGEQTGRMLMALETCMLGHKPELVLVYGDTNSTLAGALAAAKLNLPIAHVEAGLRSFNREMPEELNRVLTDRLSALLFCPTRAAVENLADEGLTKGVSLTGDVMYDVLLQSLPAARERTQVGRELGLRRGEYVVVTVHRASNTDEPGNLAAIVEALTRIEHQVAFPLHPRTRSRLQSAGMLGRLQAAPNVHVLDPLGYLEMLALMDAAGKIHRFRRRAEGGVPAGGSLRHDAPRYRVGGDSRVGMEYPHRPRYRSHPPRHRGARSHYRTGRALRRGQRRRADP